ncbi:sugar kinase [Arthrobacter sp. CC3]
MIRIAAIGECMIELTHSDESTLSIGFAGDTMNTASYLARLGGDMLQTDYISRVGDDRYSLDMLARMKAEGIGTSLVEKVPGKSPGLYLIRTDEAGERSFIYHRSTSPARDLFGPDQSLDVDETLSYYDVIYLSAVSLQILTDAARRRLWKVLDVARRRGGTVVFDTNYRPAGWDSAEAARQAIEQTLRRTDIAFPTFDDERLLFGDSDTGACVERLAAWGVDEIVVKNGSEGCLVRRGDLHETIPARVVAEVLDTTGAGDSFNAGYLAARFAGSTPVAAAKCGHALAAEVIRWPGAVIPSQAMPAPALNGPGC